jgi:hypothetical protein
MLTHRLDVLERVGEGCLVQGGVRLGPVAEVDHPPVPRPTREVPAIHPRPKHIRVWPSVRIRCNEHLARDGMRDIERTDGDDAHERDPEVLAKRAGLRHIDAGGQVGVDLRDRLPVERSVAFAAAVLADEADVDGRA